MSWLFSVCRLTTLTFSTVLQFWILFKTSPSRLWNRWNAANIGQRTPRCMVTSKSLFLRQRHSLNTQFAPLLWRGWVLHFFIFSVCDCSFLVEHHLWLLVNTFLLSGSVFASSLSVIHQCKHNLIMLPGEAGIWIRSRALIEGIRY